MTKADKISNRIRRLRFDHDEMTQEVAIVPVSKEPLKEATGMLQGDTSLVQALLKFRKEDANRGK